MTEETTKTPTDAGDSTSATKPAGPTVPPPVPSAMDAFRAAAQAKFGADQKPADGADGDNKKPEDADQKPEDGEKPDAEGDQEKKNEEGEGDGQEGDDDALTPEEQEFASQLANRAESEETIYTQVAAYSSQITPETQAWLESHRQARLNRINEFNDAAKSATPTVPDGAKEGEGATGDLTRDEYAQLNVPPSMRSVKDTSSPWEPKYFKPDDLRQFEIDPNKIPKKYAQAFEHIMKTANQAAANGDYFRKEAKTAFAKRDDANSKLFEREYSDALKAEGFEAGPETKAILSEVRSLAFVNGKPQPWPKVLNQLASKYPNIMRKAATGDSATKPPVSTGNDSSGKATAPPAPASPKPPEGTRSTQQTNTPPPAKPKTMAETQAAFREQAAKYLKK